MANAKLRYHAKVQREIKGAAAPFLEPQGLEVYRVPRVM